MTDWCFYIDPLSFVEGHGYIPSVVKKGVAGHALLAGNGTGSSPYYWGMTYETACAVAEKANSDMGVTPEDALDIRISSMQAKA